MPLVDPPHTTPAHDVRPRPRASSETHADLLVPGAQDSGRRLDAIVISAFRPAENLRPAMRLAADVSRRLVVLCSGSARSRDVLRLADEVADLPHAVVPVLPGYDHEHTHFRTSALARLAGGLGDLSVKRKMWAFCSAISAAGGPCSSWTTTSPA